MSVIVASGAAICNSPLNHSKSKQLYSFSKSERFPSIKLSGDGKSFYSLPEVRMRRSPSFGYGSKFDFTAAGKGKCNKIYNKGSDFDQLHPHSPKYSFGLGRDKFEKAYCEGAPNVDWLIPGPGKYSIWKPFGSESVKFTMRQRNKSTTDLGTNIGPGPGSYEIPIQISPLGKYVSSNIKNVMQWNISADKSQRSDFSFNKNPGPAEYPQKQWLGNIFDSRHKSSQGRSIYGKVPDFDSRANYPGPGAYRVFSEWGIYESKNAKQADEKNKESQEKK